MTAWAPQGSAFHTGMELWEKSERALSAQECADYAVADYDDRIDDQRKKQPEDSGWLTGGRTKPQVDIDRRRDRVAKQVKDYIEYSLANEHQFRPARLPDGRPAIEFDFEIEYNGVILKGAIDLVLEWADGSITIRDLKTGNKLPNDPLQLAVYAHAWEDYFGDVIQWGDFFMCKNNAPTEFTDLTRFTRPMVGAWLEMMNRSEKEGIYLPAPGDHCRVCTVSGFCSLMGGSNRDMMPNMLVENYQEDAI